MENEGSFNLFLKIMWKLLNTQNRKDNDGEMDKAIKEVKLKCGEEGQV